CKHPPCTNMLARRHRAATLVPMENLRHSVRRLADCHNIADFRALARRRLPYPVFHYIDGAADDEISRMRNTAAFDEVDLVPDVLAGVEQVDTSVTVLGRK